MDNKMVSVILLVLLLIGNTSSAVNFILEDIEINETGTIGKGLEDETITIKSLDNAPWPMFNRDLNHSSLSPYNTSKNDGGERWNFTTGGPIMSSPAIGPEGAIYVGSDDNKLYAIKSNGSLAWEYSTDGFIRSSPAISSEGVIYVGSNDTKLHAVKNDGNLEWTFSTGGAINSSPAISLSGTIYAGSNDNYLYAINPNGVEKWRFSTSGQVRSSPAIGQDGTIYVGSDDNNIYAINPNGTENWRFSTSGQVRSSPAIGQDGTIYVGSDDNNIYAINPNGTQKWRFTTGDNVRSTPAISNDGTIYIGSDDCILYSVNPYGSEIWNFTTGGPIKSSPSIGAEGTIYAGSEDGKLYAVNTNGEEEWNFTSTNIITSSPSIGAEGTIIIGTHGNNIYKLGDTTPPTVRHTVPDNNFREIPLEQKVKVIFDESLDTYKEPQIKQIEGMDPGGWEFLGWSKTFTDNDTISWIHDNWVYDDSITLLVSDYEDEAGNTGDGYEWSFQTKSSWPKFRSDLRNTGRSIYNTTTVNDIKWNISLTGNIESSPSVSSNGTIYIGSLANSLYAINPDGTEKWVLTMNGGIRSSPTIGPEGIIYTGCDDNRLYAISPEGTEKWNFSTNSNIVSSPSISKDGIIYFGSLDNNLYALNQNGTKIWHFLTENSLWSSPAIGDDGTIFVGSDDGRLYAINADGSEKWNYATGGPVRSSPAIGDDGTIFVGSNDWSLYAINPDGSEKWNYATGGPVRSSPAIGDDGTIFVGSDDGRLYAINPDGSEKWNYATGGPVRSSPAIGDDGNIYVGSNDNKLHVINSNGSLRWLYATDGSVRSSPAISFGEVYVGSDDGNLYCFADMKPPEVKNTRPRGDQIGVDLSQEVVVVFDESMNIDVTPVLNQTVGTDPGHWEFKGWFTTNLPDDTARWRHPPWNYNEDITMIVSGFEDKAGNEGNEYNWSFTTSNPWPMFRQNPGHTGRSPYNTSHIDGLEVWSFNTGGDIRSSPAIAGDGTLYVGSYDNRLYAINPDGTEKWNFTTGGSIHSSPAIAPDGTIYVGSLDNNLYAVNHLGNLEWSFTTGGSIYSSPVIDFNRTIYIGSDDTNLYAIYPNGVEKWRYGTNGIVRSSPAIDSNGTIYVGSNDNRLHAVNPDGTGKWQYSTGGSVISSPAIGCNGDIYVGSYDRHLYSIDRYGNLNWRRYTTSGGQIASSPAIGEDGTIYFGANNNRLYALNPANGNSIWTFTTPGNNVQSSPAVGSDGTIYVGSDDNRLYAVNPDGSEKWRITTGGNVYSSPAIAPDGTLYFGSNDNKLYKIGDSTAPSISATSPSDGDSEVFPNQKVIVIFDETMDTTRKPSLTQNYGSNPGGWSFKGWTTTNVHNDTATWIHHSWDRCEMITMTITDYYDIWGNPGEEYTWTFFTEGPWRMFSHDKERTGNSPYNTSLIDGKVWDFSTGNNVQSSPAIASDGTIYIGSNDGKLYAINSDGTLQWEFTSGGAIISSPALGSDGAIYIGSSDNYLYAINSDGTERWRVAFNSDIVSAPAIDIGNILYVGSLDNRLYALNPNGTEKWNFTTGGSIRSSPAIGSDGTIYFGSEDNRLYALNPNGTEKWNFTTGGSIRSSPAIGPDGTIYFGSDDQNIYAIQPDGTKKWQFITGNSVRSSPAVGSDGTIFIGSNDNNLYAINPDGTEKWHLTTEGQILSSPALGSDGTIFIGSNDNNLYAINPDGMEKWSFTTGGDVVSSPAIGIGNVLYIGSNDNNIYKFGDVTAPYVISTEPQNTSTNVDRDRDVVIVFSETLDTDIEPILTQTEGDDTGGWIFLGWSSTNIDNDTVTWTHNTWKDNENISLEISNYVDYSGNIGLQYEWSFSTEDTIPCEIYDHSPSKGTTGDTFTFNASVTDNSAVESVYVYYHTDVSEPVNHSMIYAGDNLYVKTVILPSNGTMIFYVISAKDTSNNWNDTGIISTPILDNDPPQIVDNSPDIVSTGDQYTFNATVKDNMGVDAVHVYYWTDASDSLNTTMNNVGGDFYELTIIIPNEAKVLYYNLSASDLSGNWNETEVKTVTVEDDEKPYVVNNSPDTGTTGDLFKFNATVTDNIVVASVYANYWTDVSEPVNNTMNNVGGDFYERTISVPKNATIMYYIISARDGAGNWASTSQQMTTIIDNDKPIIIDNTPTTSATGEPFTFNATVTDNIGVDYVYVYHWTDVSAPINNTMNIVGGDFYQRTIGIPSDATKLYYNISAIDSSGNWASTGVILILVGDNLGPSITDNTPVSCNTGQFFTFNATVTDNIGVESVHVYYWTDVSNPANNTMNHVGEDYYARTIAIPNNATELYYVISAKDTSDNWGSTGQVLVVVIDNMHPSITDNTPDSGTTGDILTFNATVTDNIGVDTVYVYYWTDVTSPVNNTMNLVFGNYYERTLTIPNNAKELHYIISAKDTSDNWASTGQLSIPIVDNIKPTITDNSPDTTTTGTLFTFNATVTDNIMVDTVHVYYWTDVSEPYNNTMKYADGDYYTQTITIPNDATLLYYIISAKDTTGNWASTDEISVTIIDNEGPIIIDNTSGSATTGEPFMFNASVTDNIGVDAVYVEYWTDVSNPTNQTMDYMGGNYYERIITIPDDATELHYIISAKDMDCNWANIGQTVIVVTDNKPPIIMDNTPDQATTGDYFTFNATVTDNIFVYTVYVKYWTDGMTPINNTMVHVGENCYIRTIIIPNDATELYYIISAKDTSDNWANTSQVLLLVIDNKPPLITDNSPDLATTGESLVFNATVTDNMGVDTVHVKYWTDVTTSTNNTMYHAGGNFYIRTIAIPNDATELYYIISAKDVSGNWANISQVLVVVIDNEPPSITDNTPINGTTGGTLPFNATVMDNIGVDTVYVYYWTDVTSPVNNTMNLIVGNHYERTITIPNDATELYYIISAKDSSGNWANTGQMMILVSDDKKPSIIDNTPDLAFTGVSFVFNASVTDNIGVETIYVHYWTDVTAPINNTMVFVGGDCYERTITIPNDATELYYEISAKDVSGNWASTGQVLVTVVDNKPPSITDNTAESSTTGDIFTFNASVTDNMGVDWVYVRYWTDVTNPVNNTMVHVGGDCYERTITIPNDATKLYYEISAKDVSGNWASTGQVLVTVVDNKPPSITDNTPDSCTTGGILIFNATVTDNIGVDNVYVHYWTDVSSPVNNTMNHVGGYSYVRTITIPNDATELYYIISAKDSSGNWANTGHMMIPVSDNKKPSIVDNTPDLAFTGDSFVFNASVTDNIGVYSVHVKYWTDVTAPINNTMIFVGGNFYERMVSIPDHATELYYTISARDKTGNWENTSQTLIVVSDNQKPHIIDRTSDNATTGESFTFNASVTDNIGVQAVYVYYWTDVTTPTNNTMNHIGEDSYERTITVPSDATVLYYIISARDISGNWANNGELIITVKENIPPYIVDKSQEVGSTGELYTFSAEVTDNDAVKTVYVLYYTDVTAKEFIEIPNIGEDIFERSVLIPSGASRLYYNISAVDFSGNIAETGLKMVTINDIVNPEISDDSLSYAHTGGSFTFDAVATDNIAVEVVHVNYWTDVSGSINNTMNLVGGDRYRLTITIPTSSTELHYIISAKDTSGNWAITKQITLAITDNIKPTIDDCTPSEGAMGDTFTFYTIATDNIGIDNVYVFYWTDVSGPFNHTMQEIDMDNYEKTIILPNNATTLRYVLSAIDKNGNWIAQQEKIVYVHDLIPPSIVLDVVSVVEIGDYLNFSAENCTDNIKIENYTWTIKNEFMNLTFYEVTFDYRFLIKGNHTVTLNVTDSAGNSNKTTFNIIAKDSIPPEPVLRITSKREGEYFKGEMVTLNASESYDLGEITNYLWIIQIPGEEQTVTLSGETVNYTFTTTGRHVITLHVTDWANNTAIEEKEIMVESSGQDILNWVVPIAIAIGILLVVLYLLIKKPWKKNILAIDDED